MKGVPYFKNREKNQPNKTAIPFCHIIFQICHITRKFRIDTRSLSKQKYMWDESTYSDSTLTNRWTLDPLLSNLLTPSFPIQVIDCIFQQRIVVSLLYCMCNESHTPIWRYSLWGNFLSYFLVYNQTLTSFQETEIQLCEPLIRTF